MPKGKLNTNEIRIGATFHVTRKELTRTPRKDAQEYAIRDLANRLSYHIVSRCAFFKVEEVEGGLQLRADCYVLTPDDFSKLVESIQRDLLRFGPVIGLGGVNSG